MAKAHCPAASGLLPGLLRQAAQFLRVRAGLRSVPTPPGGNWLLGHALPLLRNCAWDQMQWWVQAHPPIVKVRVLFRSAHNVPCYGRGP